MSAITNYLPTISENTKDNLILAGKVLAVAIVIAGLVAATVFTAGAAGAAFGVAFAASNGIIGKFVVAGVLTGVATGLGIGSFASLWTATVGRTWNPLGFNTINVNLWDKHADTSEEIGKFLYCSITWSAVGVVWGTFKGVEIGFKCGIFAAILRAFL